MAAIPSFNVSSVLGLTDSINPNSTISDIISEVATKSTLPSTVTTSQVKTPTERLYQIRPRTADLNELGPEGRGRFAYIKLLTNSTLQKAYSSGDISKRSINLDNPQELMTFASKMSAQGTSGYDRFFLTGVSCSLSEKLQITEVFGDGEIAYFFGRQPIMFNFTGLIFDSPDNTWFTDWMRMYSEFFRGTQLARNYELLKIVLPNMTITGSIVSMSYQQGSDRDQDIPFTFQFLAKLVEPTPIVAPSMVYNNNVQRINFPQAAGFFSQSSINALKSNSNISGAINVIQNPASSLFDKAQAIMQVGSGLSGAASSIDAATKSLAFGTNETINSPLFQGINATLNGIRSSLFSPIYGVLSSLSKLITTVTKGGIAIFGSLTSPVRNILRDITNISNSAIALVNLVNTSISGFGRFVTGELRGLSTDYHTAIKTVGKAAGVISSAPATILQSLAHMFQTHQLSRTPAFLNANPKGSLSLSASLSHGSSVVLDRTAILKSGSKFNPAASSTLDL